MHFDLTEDQKTIKATARELLDSRGALRVARELVETGVGGEELWSEIAELGWPGIAIPEKLGGLGLGLVELCCLLEELGYALAPVPMLGSALTGLAIDRSGAPAQRHRWLPELASGATHGGFGPAELAVDAVGAGVITLAGDDSGEVLAAAEATLTPVTLIDGTRHSARVAGATEPLDVDWPSARAAIRTGIAADALGVAQRALDLSVAYAKDRNQFGRPIGSYQAIAHRLAAMLRSVEAIRSAVYWSAWACDANAPERELASSIAKAVASDHVLRVTRSAIQVHGGIGFTWEHDCHLLLKRAHVDATLMGAADFHYERVATLLANPPSAIAA